MAARRTKRQLDAKAAAREMFLPKRGRPLPSRAPTKAEAVKRNVVGVGIGRKLVKGKRTKVTSVRIYVQHKLDESLVPKKYRIPETIKGVPTDVIQVGRFEAGCNDSGGAINRKHSRPCAMGVSIGHEAIMAGTAGALLRLKGDIDGRRFLLSNNHVMANENSLPIGAGIFQPGLRDGAQARIATLSEFIALSRTENVVDCAIAELDDVQDALPELISLGSHGRRAIRAREQMAVAKSGRTTGATRGKVVDVDFDVLIDYPILGSLLFEDQILIAPADGEPFSCKGDSGALIVTDNATRSPVGLLVGSSPETGKTIACHLSDVFDLLRIDDTALEFA